MGDVMKRLRIAAVRLLDGVCAEAARVRLNTAPVRRQAQKRISKPRRNDHFPASELMLNPGGQ
jgi:hypothetical protein